MTLCLAETIGGYIQEQEFYAVNPGIDDGAV
jgi:hypothetical protein